MQDGLRIKCLHSSNPVVMPFHLNKQRVLHAVNVLIAVVCYITDMSRVANKKKKQQNN